MDANKRFCECTVFKWNQERQREMLVFVKYVDEYNFKTPIYYLKYSFYVFSQWWDYFETQLLPINIPIYIDQNCAHNYRKGDLKIPSKFGHEHLFKNVDPDICS